MRLRRIFAWVPLEATQTGVPAAASASSDRFDAVDRLELVREGLAVEALERFVHLGR